MSYSREHGVSRAPVKSSSREPDAETREKQSRAVDLRRAGASYSEIAQALGYRDQSGAKKAVEAAIRRHEFEATKEVLLLDLARLDEYQKLATHRLRTSGDLNQIDRLMRIMEKRHWILGVTPATLAEANTKGDMKTPGGMNVVIAATERTFVRGMMQAVGMDPDSEEGRAYLRKQGLDEESEKPRKKKGAGSKPRLRKKPPHALPPGTSESASEPLTGEVLTRDEVAREEAKKISVRQRDEDQVTQGVILLDSQRI